MKTTNQACLIAKCTGPVAKRMAVCLTLAISVAQLKTAYGAIITPDRLVDWTPGVMVGVPGGIPINRTNLIDVTKAPYNADKTGVNDATAAINAAISAAHSNDVVYLPAGTYKLNNTLQIGYNNKGITLRGAGTNSTKLNFTTSASTGISVGTGSDYSWAWPTSGNQVTAGLSKGSTNITIADTSAFSVGQIIQIGMANDTNIPVISVFAYDQFPNNQPMRRQKTRVVGKTSTTLTVWPPLYDDYSAVTNIVHVAQLQSDFVGIEDMYVELGNSTCNFGIEFEQCYGCWIKNVVVHLSSNYQIFLYDSLNCEVRHCTLDTINHGGSNGAGMIQNTCSGILFEDNIVLNAFPGIEINHGSCGNVFAYNFFLNTNGLACIDSNHGPHNNLNLYEGNILGNFECDGYFGGDSQDTLYRNWINGQYTQGDGVSNHIGWCVALKRFTRENSIVGNIIGTPGDTMSDQGISLGQPNIGNSSSTGFGPPWTDGWTNGPGTLSQSGNTVTVTKPFFTPAEIYDANNAKTWQLRINNTFVPITAYISPTSVTVQTAATYSNVPYLLTPATWGWQELDQQVAATLIRVGNYNCFDNAIPASEALGGNTLANSLYQTIKPAWFGNMSWPPFDPTANVTGISFASIPAGYRFIHGVDPGGIAQPPVAVAGANLTTGTAPLVVTFSSAGSSDPNGATLTYNWQFGDGATATTANPSHTYASAGTYFPFLTVSNGTNQGSSSTITITVTNAAVATNHPPIAAASGAPLSGTVPLTVNFSSAGSSDPDGTALTYSWQFGDGVTSTTANPSHTYASAGTFSVHLFVSDGTNTTAATAITITATNAPGTNRPPVAVAGGAPLSGTVPLTVNFSSAGSSDPDGTALTYSWQFGDGVTSPTANPSHTYASAGTFSVHLFVSDGTNTTPATAITITATNASGTNRPPVAVANASSTVGATPLSVTFSSAGSSDPEGATLTYSWTFGDGTTSTAANPSHTYSTPGTYSALLTVSDGTNQTPASAITITTANVSNGPVAVYGFDEGTGTTALDTSGNGNTGTVNVGTWTKTGKFGGALSFNGTSSSVTVNDSASLDLSVGMTLEAWVNPTALSAQSGMNIIIKPLTSPSSVAYVLLGAAKTTRLPSTAISTTLTNLSGSSLLPLNTWSHLAATYDGATMRLYVNGVQVASAPQTGPIAASSQPLTIGSNWSGLIDEVRIYNRALSASQILTDMNTAVNPPPAPPSNLRLLAN